VVEFELAAAFDLVGVRAPKRQCIANICQWVYRSTECGYTGSNYFSVNDEPVSGLDNDVCGKRLTSCKLRFGATSELPYGSFPGIGAYTV
jgi:lambda family phage minor tail protein L